MAWCESIGVGSGIIDLVSDKCSSPHRRHPGRYQHAGGEGADLACTTLTRSVQHFCWYDAAPVVRGVGLHYCSAPAAQERTHRAALVVSIMFAVLRTVVQELAAGMLLVNVKSKSDRTFACVLRPVIGTVGIMYYINMSWSHGRATGARSRRGSSAPCCRHLRDVYLYVPHGQSSCFTQVTHFLSH